MTLPADFKFSQASLQDYQDCRRRFELRYLERLPWPAVQTEPYLESERIMQQGAAFHHLVQQHQIGLPVELLSAQIKDDELEDWWQRYLDSSPEFLLPRAEGHVRKYPERLLVTPLAGYTLLAKMDLLIIQPGRYLRIVDWKTSRRKPKRSWLASRLQTMVYRFMAVEAAGHLNDGEPVQADQVDILYWFTATPKEPEIFTYSQEQYLEDRQTLIRMIEEIAARQTGDFPLTPDEQRCRYCVYRSLCDRGIDAGGLDQWLSLGEESPDQLLESGLDFDQIAEIEF